MQTRTTRHLGEAVQKFREGQHISVRTLARKSGFSASFISQVEKDRASPSIASLERIAAALGVTLAQFFHSTEADRPAVTKSTRRERLTSGWSRATIELLAPVGVGSRLEPIMITMAPGGASSKSALAKDRHQFAIVCNGEVTLTLDGRQELLERGDSVMIPPATPHRWHNAASTSVQILIVSGLSDV